MLERLDEYDIVVRPRGIHKVGAPGSGPPAWGLRHQYNARADTTPGFDVMCTGTRRPRDMRVDMGDTPPADMHGEDHGPARSGRAASLVDQGRYGEALECLDVSDPGHALVRGAALAGLGRDEEALACFDEVLGRDPGDRDALLGRVAALCALDRFGEALEAASAALDVLPEDPRMLRYKGSALGALGRLEEGLECMDQALERSPGDAGLHTCRALMLRTLGFDDAALESVERALELDPGDGMALEVRREIEDKT